MSAEIALTNDKLIEYLKITGVAQNLTKEEQNNFLEIAQVYGLNPFKREIYISKYGQNCSIITGYEVYIKRAERSGQLDGWEAITTGSVEIGDLKATVTIYRKDRTKPFVWEAYYDECVQKTREGKVTQFWQKSRFMTKKVAISQAFRLCFSDELGGMPYTADEMPEVTHDVEHVEVIDPKEVKKAKIPVLTKEQFDVLILMDADKIEKYLIALEEGKRIADVSFVIMLEDKLTELKNQ